MLTCRSSGRITDERSGKRQRTIPSPLLADISSSLSSANMKAIASTATTCSKTSWAGKMIVTCSFSRYHLSAGTHSCFRFMMAVPRGNRRRTESLNILGFRASGIKHLDSCCCLLFLRPSQRCGKNRLWVGVSSMLLSGRYRCIDTERTCAGNTHPPPQLSAKAA